MDSRETRILRVWDMGFFMYVAWPIIVPYYLTRTRGLKRALLLLLLAACIYIGALVAGEMMFRKVS